MHELLCISGSIHTYLKWLLRMQIHMRDLPGISGLKVILSCITACKRVLVIYLNMPDTFPWAHWVVQGCLPLQIFCNHYGN